MEASLTASHLTLLHKSRYFYSYIFVLKTNKKFVGCRDSFAHNFDNQMTGSWQISSLYVCMVNIKYLFGFVETPRKFIIAEVSIRKLGSSSVLITLVLLALMNIRAYGSKALQ